MVYSASNYDALPAIDAAGIFYARGGIFYACLRILIVKNDAVLRLRSG